MAPDDDVGLTICLTGPESTGKTTLALALAARLGARVVPECAREILSGRDGYGPEDLFEIARAQLSAERAARAEHAGLLLCDTDLLVVRIWWREKFGAVPLELRELEATQSTRGYLLLAPDLPWAPDPLRENPADRERLYALYLDALTEAGFAYRVVRGADDARIACGAEALASLCEELREGAAAAPQA